MFERFTDQARRVVVLAQDEARRLNHSYIGTEHILLGLLEEGGIAAQALTRFNLDLTQARNDVAEIIGAGTEPPPGQIPFTPRAKKVLELSLRESLGLGHSYIGTEHILLGLLREGEGVANQMLAQHRITAGPARAVILELLGSASIAAELPPKQERSGACPHPAEALEVKPVKGFRIVRCSRCGHLVGVLPAA